MAVRHRAAPQGLKGGHGGANFGFPRVGPGSPLGMNFSDESPEERDNETGSEGDSTESAESLPGAPTEDDAEAGDTDQHSDSDA